MNISLPRAFRSGPSRLLLLCLGGLPLAGACGSEDAVTTPPADYAVQVESLDSKPVTDTVELRCDATLAVETSIASSDDRATFTLRPAGACGTSVRCGFVRAEALDEDGNSLARADAATLSVVLRIAADRLSRVASIRVSLISGVDGKPVLNQDKSEVTSQVSPSFEAPSDCSTDSGTGGAGGAGGAASGGAPSGGAGAGGAAEGGSGGAAEGGSGGAAEGGSGGAAEGGTSAAGASSGGADAGASGAGGAI